MIDALINMYRICSITGYQLMMDCLHHLDPANPDLVLAKLPSEVLDEVLAYAGRYDPRRPRSPTFPPPAEDQVRSAEKWIEHQASELARVTNLTRAAVSAETYPERGAAG